ncbi:MAG TPA: hypothetical protein PK535_10980, partial [Synergistaceae bacterium]|nr:hypothetical protein [Synergistaceae bacterium]
MAALLAALVMLVSRPVPVGGTFRYPEVLRIEKTHDPSLAPTGALALSGGAQVGDRVNFWAQDFTGEYTTFYLTGATCRAVGERAYVFVEDTQWGVNFDQDGV